MIFRQESCFSCHEVFGNGASYGPSLDGIGSRRTHGWLQDYLRNPRPGVSAKPYRLRMPSYEKLGRDKLDALVYYLQGLRIVDKDGQLVDPPVDRVEKANAV
jgi:cbb3-type cytochrome oxidase cytochrome c subunit